MKFWFLVSNTQTDWDDAETQPKPTSACMSYAGLVQAGLDSVLPTLFEH